MGGWLPMGEGGGSGEDKERRRFDGAFESLWLRFSYGNATVLICIGQKKKLPRGFEPRLLDSEPRVLTVTPRGHSM